MVDAKTIIDIIETISFVTMASTACILYDRKREYPQCRDTFYCDLNAMIRKVPVDDSAEANIDKILDDLKDKYYTHTTIERIQTKQIILINAVSLFLFLSTFLLNWFERAHVLIIATIFVSLFAFVFIRVRFDKIFKAENERTLLEMSRYAEDCKKQKQQRRREIDRAYLK